ncbi:hypothetical protein N9V96_02515 [Polaribacter sp.]|nr:hypothetical protein [Polaribacter sp.]
MKKTIFLLLTIASVLACTDNNDYNNFTYSDLPIDSYTVPDSLTLNEQDTIAVTYTLPNTCYSFSRIFLEEQQQDTSIIVAVRAFVDLDDECTEQLITEEYKFLVTATQQEDYLFKFFKGQTDDGENIFEEVTIPVN